MLYRYTDPQFSADSDPISPKSSDPDPDPQQCQKVRASFCPSMTIDYNSVTNSLFVTRTFTLKYHKVLMRLYFILSFCGKITVQSVNKKLRLIRSKKFGQKKLLIKLYFSQHPFFPKLNFFLAKYSNKFPFFPPPPSLYSVFIRQQTINSYFAPPPPPPAQCQ